MTRFNSVLKKDMLTTANSFYVYGDVTVNVNTDTHFFRKDSTGFVNN